MLSVYDIGDWVTPALGKGPVWLVVDVLEPELFVLSRREPDGLVPEITIHASDLRRARSDEVPYAR